MTQTTSANEMLMYQNNGKSGHIKSKKKKKNKKIMKQKEKRKSNSHILYLSWTTIQGTDQTENTIFC